MKETKYIRNGKNIKNLESGQTEKFEFFAEAKRRSREIQMSSDGALGRGSLQLK